MLPFGGHYPCQCVLLLVNGPRDLQGETNLKVIMGFESSDVVRFDLGSLLIDQMRIAKLKSAYITNYWS